MAPTPIAGWPRATLFRQASQEARLVKLTLFNLCHAYQMTRRKAESYLVYEPLPSARALGAS